MRRILTTVLLVLAAGALFVFGSGAEGDSDGDYLVRAVFDNGSFLVPGEEVRVAGANVGEIASTEISRDDEIVSLDPEPHDDPGKAIVVLKITDPAFQDFREDASCIIRPQSLLGERFVDCQVTQPRAPGSEPPPPLEVVEDGQLGEGQYLLPLEQNGKAVDLDIVNNIMRRPYRERFSIILNELGAGLAARGDELGDIIERANPALRETDKILAILAEQDKTLARLARDSNQVLAPLARQRASVGGFIDSSGETAEASAERRADIERQFQLLPQTLRELRATMIELRRFNDAAVPVFADLGDAAPEITGATEALGPLADAATPSLKSLGTALEQASPDLVASEPVLRDVSRLANASARPATNLKKLLGDLRRKGGYEKLLGALFNISGSANGMDQYGHFLRTQFLASNCTDYVTAPLTGCQANFLPGVSTRAEADAQRLKRDLEATGELPGVEKWKPEKWEAPEGQPDAGEAQKPPTEGEMGDIFGLGESLQPAPQTGAPSQSAAASMRGADELYRFLLEPGS
jgi:phospholipid/cholesterol/gamma-HCH transport system substrate-binding protein